MNIFNKNNFSLLNDIFKQLSYLEKLTVLGLLCLPIFHLTFNNWTGIWMAFSTLFAFITLITNRSFVTTYKDPRFYWILLALVAYPFTAFMSQVGRWSFTYKAFLDISPFLYFIPILLAIRSIKFDFGKYLQIILPITIIGALWAAKFNHPELISTNWGDRLSVYFSDPLAFGQMMMTLALMCLSCIQLNMKSLKEVFFNLWSLLGFFVGIYLSIKSGSRSGWLAIPIIFFLIFIIKLNWSFKKSIPLGLIFATVCCTAMYYFSPYAQERIGEAIQNITNYPWHGIETPETSVGLRITFQRLGWFYFSQSPIWGWGNQGYSVIKDAIPVLDFSSQAARDFVYNALFHNELMTQMVRYGLLGILGYFGAVMIPLFLAMKHIQSPHPIVARSALMCTIFLICQIMTGLSDEFLNLKGMVAFYAFMICTLLCTVIHYSSSNHPD